MSKGYFTPRPPAIVGYRWDGYNFAELDAWSPGNFTDNNDGAVSFGMGGPYSVGTWLGVEYAPRSDEYIYFRYSRVDDDRPRRYEVSED